jgi:hypothetical protein
MQDLLAPITQFFAEFVAWNPPSMVLAVIVGFSILSAAMMTRFVAAAPLFSGPVSFIVLSQCAVFANFIGRSQTMMGTSDVDKTLLYTLLGQAPACLLLLVAFKANAKAVRR